MLRIKEIIAANCLLMSFNPYFQYEREKQLEEKIAVLKAQCNGEFCIVSVIFETLRTASLCIFCWRKETEVF